MPRDLPVSLRLCWSDPVTGEARSVPLEGSLRFGSNRRQNDVVLPLPSVEAFHAEILGDREGGWELVATGSRRLKVGDSMTARARRFFVTPGGLVITNHRLTAPAEGILVRTAGADAPASARVVAADAELDLALLEVPVSAPVPSARLDDDDTLRVAARALGVPPANVRAFVAAHR